jgi:hypothetical protein
LLLCNFVLGVPDEFQGLIDLDAEDREYPLQLVALILDHHQGETLALMVDELVVVVAVAVDLDQYLEETLEVVAVLLVKHILIDNFLLEAFESDALSIDFL